MKEFAALRHRARGLFIDNRTLLYQIFNGQKAVKFATYTRKELFCFYYILFFIANKAWTLKKTTYEKLVAKSLDSVVFELRKKSVLRKFLKNPKKGIQMLESLKGFWEHFIGPIFIEHFP